MGEILILPAPLSVERGTGAFDAPRPWGVHAPAMAKDAVASLGDVVRLADRGRAQILFAEVEGDLPPEAYVLTVEAPRVRVEASTREGFLRAASSLRQLLHDGPLPVVRIEDAPRFAWRGLHVDVARHAFPLADLKRFVDAMALQKFNRLHWHLTDDQGWRIEITSWPRLTSVGSRRAESPRRGAREEGDGTPYAAYYTQDDVRELVAYAAVRGISVVPEIDMPGHAQAALAAYPQVGSGAPAEVWTRWGISERLFGVHDKALSFLDDVLEEVAALFPGPFVHLGGDEAPTAEWEVCAHAAERMQAEGVADARALQGWFHRRMAATLARLGKRPVAWDEVLECGAPKETIVMAWRDAAHAQAAARAGHDVVLCPMSHAYFDHYQGPEASEPEAIGGFTDLATVHSFEPLDDTWPAEQAKHLLGVQANLWSEYIHDAEHLEYMAWPRGSALAEVAWSSREARTDGGFEVRVARMMERLEAMGVTHRRIS